MKRSTHLFVFTLLLMMTTNPSITKADNPDPNFHIYLCFGQSNMEGHTKHEEIDLNVDHRFQMMAAVNDPKLSRNKGQWYPAIPPLCRGNTGLTPADYFGRTMVANLPENIRVGVIVVAVGGCKIELFDKDKNAEYSTNPPKWMATILDSYNNNPYARLVEIARIAQKDGVIKGILLHQGESNTNEKDWPAKVKKVYDNLLSDLELKPDSVPLLAGEVVHADQKGICASMNTIIDDLPKTISNAHVVTSAGVECIADKIHFSAAGYRELGKRYAEKMLSILGYTSTKSAVPATNPVKK